MIYFSKLPTQSYSPTRGQQTTLNSMLSTSKPAGYGSPTTTFYPVVIIGAGMGGIGMACQLKEKLGFDQFRVLERQSGIGGTWWINRYPGVACDM